MSNKLVVSELDYDTILANLRSFLQSQDEFTDYDFEGSGLSVLLRVLAYNTHYQAYYMNMLANESFLDTAQLRNSVVSHAKSIGYTPYSKKAPIATINFIVNSENSTAGTLTIPRGYSFLSNLIDGKAYKFIVMDAQTVSKVNGKYTFEGLEIYEGSLASYTYIQEDLTNPKQLYTIPDSSVDTSTIKITVSPSVSNTYSTTFSRATDIVDIDSTSNVYFLQEGMNNLYQVYFGDDIIGSKIPDGGVVRLSYLVTNADSANKANNFIGSTALTDSLSEVITSFSVEPVMAAAGGADRESVDSIKYSAPLTYASQNRLVTYKDYENYIMKSYPVIDSISVWGGEDQDPPVYGKVFISIKTKNNYYISETEKTSIIENIINPKAIVTIKSEIIEPDYLYLQVSTNVQYDQSYTTLTSEELKSRVISTINLYNTTYLNKFGSRFITSKLQESINNIDTSAIIGCDSTIKAEKRITPILGSLNNYEIYFDIPLKQGNYSNKLTTSEFSTYDNGTLRNVTIEEIPNSFTGITSINIINPGMKFTSTPEVIITGDGSGATAEAIVTNGKIEEIKILTPGLDYSYANITLSGGGGYSFEGEAVIDNKIGILRTVYYNSAGERKVVDSNTGTINYDKGTVIITDILINSVNTSDGKIKINCPINTGIITSNKNSILTIDENDTYAITATITSI